MFDIIGWGKSVTNLRTRQALLNESCFNDPLFHRFFPELIDFPRRDRWVLITCFFSWAFSSSQIMFSPLGHSQWKELILSTHFPLLRHGWLAHSSVLMWQNTPSYPASLRDVSHGEFIFHQLSIICKVTVSMTTWHADAVEPSNLVQAGSIIMARIGHAFIDIHLTARTLVSLETLTLERAFGVEAATSVFTRVGSWNVEKKKTNTFMNCMSLIMYSNYKWPIHWHLNIPSEHSSMSRLQADPV